MGIPTGGLDLMWLDFREVKRNVSMHQTMQTLYLESHQFAPGWYRGWCPRCEAHTLMIVPARGVFFCAAGKITGDQLALFAHVNRVTIKEAAYKLAEFFDVKMRASHPPALVAETPGQDSGRHGRESRAQANRRRSVESGLGDVRTGD